jgi:hypothetical protein
MSDAARRIADAYERAFGSSMPFVIPEGCEPLIHDGLLVGRRVGGGLLVQADLGRVAELPEGAFQAGFYGHGANSYAFYFCEVTRDRRVFFRLPYGGVYMDNARAARRIASFMAAYAALRTHPGDALAHLFAVESMGKRRYEARFVSGKTATYAGPFRETFAKGEVPDGPLRAWIDLADD